MRTKRVLFYAVVACLFLAAGCGKTYLEQKRAEARERWAKSRGEMVIKLAEGCYNRGEFTRARQQVDEILKTGSPYAPAYVLAARLAAEKGEIDKAREYAENAKTIDPKSPEARYVLGTIEQTLGHNERALAEFSEASKLAPNEPKYVLAESEMLVAGGQTEAAAKGLDAAVGRMAGRAEIHAALGDVLQLLRRYPEAISCYRIAVRLNPEQQGLKERVATALFHSGAYVEAEPILDELAVAEPDFANGWVLRMRADCLLALGRTAEARTIYDQQAKANAASAAPLVALARCDIVENRLPSARKFLEEALVRQPQDIQANALMGYVLLATGRPGEAVPYLRLAAKDPTCEGRSTVERLLAQAEGTSAGQGPTVVPADAGLPADKGSTPGAAGKTMNSS